MVEEKTKFFKSIFARALLFAVLVLGIRLAMDTYWMVPSAGPHLYPSSTSSLLIFSTVLTAALNATGVVSITPDGPLDYLLVFVWSFAVAYALLKIIKVGKK